MDMLHLFTIMAIRIAAIYVFLLFFVRLGGKRELGQLNIFDLIIAFALGDIIGDPIIDETIPLSRPVFAISILILLEIITSQVALKNEKIRNLINGTPTVVIENGKIIRDSMKKMRYTTADLLQQLRQKNIVRLSDVEFAILETSGQLSVIPKSQKRPISPADLNINTKYEGVPIVLINDGQIKAQSLKKLNLTENWLHQELKKLGIIEVEDVLIATLDTQGRLHVDKKEDPDSSAATRGIQLT